MVQVVKYKCCDKVFAGCVEPYCYEDSDWMKDIRKYSKEGHLIQMIEQKDFEFGECLCNKQPELF